MQVLEVGSGPVRQTPLLKIEFGDYDVSLESIVCRYMLFMCVYRWFETK